MSIDSNQDIVTGQYPLAYCKKTYSTGGCKIEEFRIVDEDGTRLGATTFSE